jgi:hypothetical protein
MKNIQILILIIFIIIFFLLLFLFLFLFGKSNQKTTTPYNQKYPNININLNEQFYNEFYNYMKNNDELADTSCINCLFKKLSSKYTYSEFKNFVYLAENNNDPSIDLSQNSFITDLYNYGLDCYCK